MLVFLVYSGCGTIIPPSGVARQAVPEVMPRTIDTPMRRISFHDWLEHRSEEVPDATTIALVIAKSGAAGVSREKLEKVARISPDAVDELLRALVSAGQVVVVKVNGQRVFRAAM